MENNNKNLDKELEEALRNMFSKLSKNQKQLPDDIQKILNENRDYLYKPVDL